MLRGASKDVLNEVERNLHDAMGVARNVCLGAAWQTCCSRCVACNSSCVCMVPGALPVRALLLSVHIPRGPPYAAAPRPPHPHPPTHPATHPFTHPPQSAHPSPLLSLKLSPLQADPRLVPGGGAVEMAVSRGLAERAEAGAVEGVEQGPYRAVGQALEVIPRTLAQNCGANVIRTLTKLRARHAEQKGCTAGIDGVTPRGSWKGGGGGGGGGGGLAVRRVPAPPVHPARTVRRYAMHERPLECPLECPLQATAGRLWT